MNKRSHRRGIIPMNISCSLFMKMVFIIVLATVSHAAGPKYETAYACEGKTLTIECAPGDLINLIRANYGRFSITICNDHGNVDWSVNCMSPKSLRVLHSKCANKQNCSVLASTNMFGDPCIGTHKYLEAHYLCVSAAQTSTTTNRPSPPWLITSQPSVWSTSTIRTPTTTTKIYDEANSTTITTTTIKNRTIDSYTSTTIVPLQSTTVFVTTTIKTTTTKLNNFTTKTILQPTTQNNFKLNSTQTPLLINSNNSNNNNKYLENDNYFCGPTTVRNLFWNLTRVGEVNVQSCPGGATGIAKWRCIFTQKSQQLLQNQSTDVDGEKLQAIWQPSTPDLTQCRSLWLNSLEIRVNQRDSPLISIANDLSQVTSSKTLYGGDMLVTTKIIQIMSEKMTYDLETFPDQRQRELIVYELLLGVVKTGSNLLDAAQHFSWLDLSFEDQMRVATSLLNGLEDNAFLLAETIIRERNVVQKVKNILLSVRVLETRNIVGNEIFPDSNIEQWQISDDSIELPKGALIENSEGGLVRIVFVAFDRLESILRPVNIWNDPRNNLNSGTITNQTVQNRQRILNSKVISASLGKGRHIQLSQPIRLILKHLKVDNVTNPACVFWNYIDHAWSEDGCSVEKTNKTHTICMCNHLTNFAILMDVIDDTNSSLLSMFDDNMRVLIYISISLCILFIIIAILTLKLFSGIFVKSSRTTIYKNLYVSILAIEILFLVGIELNETNVLCGFTSTFLHCSFLCTIAWLFFEGYQLYTMLTTDDMLLEVEKSSKMIWYYLLSYGLSFTIVAISLAIDPSAYTRADYCVWMDANNLFYFTFLAPIVCFVVASVVYSTLAFYTMCKKYKTSLKNKEHTRLATLRFYLRSSIIFLIIFISSWIFGYLYMDGKRMNKKSTNIYGYFFVVLNALQGIYIFVLHCVQNENIRREYHKYVRQQTWLPKCLRCSQSSSISTSASNNQNQISNSLQPNLPPTGTILIAQNHIATEQIQHKDNIERIPVVGSVSNLGGHISPSSSSGSSHLIYNGSNCIQSDITQQNWRYQPSNQIQSIDGVNNKNVNTYDKKLLYYDRKIKKLKPSRHNEEEYFYCTEKKNRKKCNNEIGRYNKADTMHAMGSAYKQSNIIDNKPELDLTINYLKCNKPLCSDDEHSDSHLIHCGDAGILGNQQCIMYHPNNSRHQQYYHSGEHPSRNYSHYQQTYGEEPVYEEIINSRVTNDYMMNDDGTVTTNDDLLGHRRDDESLSSRPFVNNSYDFGNICYKHPDNIEVQAQPQISRNISAILDDNNTVICYLEPLPKNL